MPHKRDQRTYNRNYYSTHRAAEIERVRIRQAATLEFLRDLRRRPCADCGGTFPPHVMDFDHRDPRAKRLNLTNSRAMLMTRSRLRAELDKCDIVCSNCHAERTYLYLTDPNSSYRRRAPGKSSRIDEKRAYWRCQAELLRKLRDKPCADCGQRFPFYVMQFDHRDSSTKAAVVSRMVGRAGEERILAEVAKCDVVCSNCHRIRTYERRQVPTIKTGTLAAGVL